MSDSHVTEPGDRIDTAVPPPLATLDPAGQPTTISYSVPEPTSYSGRNYIEIGGFTSDPFLVPAVEEEVARGYLDQTNSPPQTMRATSSTAVSASLTGAESPASGLRMSDALPVIPTAPPGGMTVQLTRLSSDQLQWWASRGKSVEYFANSAGLLDYRVVDETVATRVSASALPGGSGGGLGGTPASVSVFIDAPADGSTARGTSQGLTTPVSGHWEVDGSTARPAVSLSADGQKSVEVSAQSNGSWSGSATFTSSGPHTLKADARLAAYAQPGKIATVTDSASITLNVELSSDQTPPPVVPNLVISSPANGSIVQAPNGHAQITVTGSIVVAPSQTATVTLTDKETRDSVTVTVAANGTVFTASLDNVVGLGPHTLVAVATLASGVVSPEASTTITLTKAPPAIRVRNSLMIVETLNISSFLGDYGAGRTLKTFSLLPGEKTTISTKSYSSSTETRTEAASILDSAASEASHDFDETLSNEQTNKNAAADSSNFKVGAAATSSFGFGNASISAEYSGAANSAREEAVKNVATATRKHALKASTNRSVTVNTETASTSEQNLDDSTLREISNINVSRTLNFVFRQMNQEHIVLYHLTDARLAFYQEEIPLDSAGNPQKVNGQTVINKVYTEATLPEINALLNSVVKPDYIQKIHDAIVNALSGIPDYTDTLQTLVETATPTDRTGAPVESGAYLRVVRNLRTKFVDPFSEFSVDVPGIVLSFDHIVQRTDGIFVDTILGQGDGLDQYSHGMQDAAIADRETARARDELARSLVTSHDEAGAAIFQRLFLPQQPAPAIVLETQTTEKP